MPRDSRMAPSDAAAMPLPSEDTTPPVTNTYLVMEKQAAGKPNDSRNAHSLSAASFGCSLQIFGYKDRLFAQRASRRRMVSNRQTAAAAPTFSDSTASAIGIRIFNLAAAATSSRTPRPSEPNTQATGPESSA